MLENLWKMVKIDNAWTLHFKNIFLAAESRKNLRTSIVLRKTVGVTAEMVLMTMIVSWRTNAVETEGSEEMGVICWKERHLSLVMYWMRARVRRNFQKLLLSECSFCLSRNAIYWCLDECRKSLFLCQTWSLTLIDQFYILKFKDVWKIIEAKKCAVGYIDYYLAEEVLTWNIHFRQWYINYT
jgi:hypothetical protein